jgi:hypothetical protein
MNNNLRINDDSPLQNGSPAEPEGLEALRQARAESHQLARSAEETIERVLSGDSLQYLREARQHIGQ